jgi:hypothetical protein
MHPFFRIWLAQCGDSLAFLPLKLRFLALIGGDIAFQMPAERGYHDRSG